MGAWPWPGKVPRRDVLKAASGAGLWAGLGGRGFVTGSSARAAEGTGGGAQAGSRPAGDPITQIDLPDRQIVEAYERAALQNVVAALNPKVFFGYWSVCADGKDFGYGYTYPSLDGHQMADALLWLGRLDEVKANWDYVRSFQRPNGHLPIAIMPGLKEVAGTPVDPNGGFYKHWVPADPLRALGGTTYVQNADILFRYTQDLGWLKAQMRSVNLAAAFLAGLTTPEGLVGGAGYYVERPTRVEYDGVTQCHAVDAFRRVSRLNARTGDAAAAGEFQGLADRIASCFQRKFWVKDHFAEYIHPERGLIDRHGLTDVNWAALATDVAMPEQREVLWPLVGNEARFYFGGMPTGIATHPETYEAWEFTHPDKQDLAAMGRVWHLEAWARSRMGDGDGLVDGIRRVCKAGREDNYYWRERYGTDGQGKRRPFGANKYCEYPANLIRIVQRFVFGVDLGLDGAVSLAPTVPAAWWDAGFGQELSWRGQTLKYRMQRGLLSGEFRGKAAQRLRVRFAPGAEGAKGTSFRCSINGRPERVRQDGDFIVVGLPVAETPCRFEMQKG